MAPTNQEVERLERSLNRSVLKRDKQVNQLLILYNLARQVESDPSVLPLFIARKNDLETVIVDFHLDQEDIMEKMIDLGRIEEFKAHHSDIETIVMEQYYYIQAVGGTVACCRAEAVPKSGSHINLPKISLPHFNGEIINWRSFRDTFASLVHENPNLTAVERFHYLISSVSGAASAVVRSVPLSGPNYEVAWKALHDRFDNTRLIVHAHLDKLFGFSPLASESLSGLKAFLNVFQENTAAIDALGITDLSGFILFYVASRVLDTTTKRLFEAEHQTADLPTLKSLLTFIQSRCQVIQNSSITSVISDKKLSFMRQKPPALKTSLLGSTFDRDQRCYACQGTHYLYKCDKFRKLNPSARLQLVRSKNMCTNCLSSSHISNMCTSKYTCRICSGKHNSLLHLDSHNRQTGSKSKTSTPEPSTSGTSTDDSTSIKDAPFVGTVSSDNLSVLGTAIIRIRNRSGHWVPVRALIDCGSQISVMTTKCATRIGLPRRNSDVSVIGLSQSVVMQGKGVITIHMVPRLETEPQINCESVVLDKITGLMPSKMLDSSISSQYQDLELADPHFDRPGPIDFLLGADIYNHLFINRGQVRHIPGLPSAFETVLGWIIVGSAPSSINSLSHVSLTLMSEPSIKRLLQRFWEVEEPVVTSNPFTEEQKCEEMFSRTTVRDESGRYSVSFPFKTDPSTLGDSRSMALSRLYNLERKLSHDPIIYEAYRNFMDEYINLGHMQLAQAPGKYFIPHHAVVKRVNDTIKLRVVFDASARTSSGISLNDLLFTGPKLQRDIFDLLLRCRFHKYMFTADICKMYRQIHILPTDRKYQHILWRDDPSKEIKEYALSTVTYGVSSSPFQAIRVLHQLEMDEGSRYPVTKNILSDQTYVDDIITGAMSLEEVLLLQKQLISLLAHGGFELKKWASNCPEVLRDIDKNDQIVSLSFEPKDECSVKILGLHWDPCNDIFSYHSDNIVDSMPTKRSVLSSIAKIYDPLGMLAPITFWAKCFMQRLWKQGYDWDQHISDEFSLAWNMFSVQLPLVSRVRIHRYIPIEHSIEVQLVGFSDASLKGYSAVVYLRLSYSSKVLGTVHLLTARSRVAPVKCSRMDDTLTVPRLELCGALLLAQTLHRTQAVLSSIVRISSLHAWTDSTVVLSWLTTPQVEFKVFVTNRLKKIHELLPACEWRYISSAQNPADCVSRGLLPSEALENNLYWDGPLFLMQPPENWSSTPFESIPVSELPELKTVVETLHVILTPAMDDDWINQFSSLTRMKRVIAYMHRFIIKVKHKINQKDLTHSHDDHPQLLTGFLRHQELQDALHVVVRITQNLYFKQLFKLLLSSSSQITPRSLACLTPFIDDSGIIRVGGRIRRSGTPENFKFPILLPKSCTLTTLIIQHYHLYSLHAGPQLVSSLISSQFWIMSGRSIIRHTLFKCVICTRHRASTERPIMGELPSSRVCPSRPFSHVGIDYAGPLLVKTSNRRNSPTNKCYIAIFICMTTKAIHIEVVSSLSTSAFLASLQRFIARRGIPSEISSDCGTNFQGAAKELRRILSNPVAQNMFSHSVPCQWNFNPPAAPHFGGLWEAAVKSMKHHLKRVIGTHILNFEEMCTITQRIEAILNSRPITPQSSNPNDLRALTPGHFLIGAPLIALPEPDMTQTPINRLTRWQLLDQFHQSLWKRWSVDYLRSVQVRTKWHRKQHNVRIGDLVLIHAPNVPPANWKMGRVENIHPGEDGVVRVVTLRTSEGTLKRPVVKIAVLPIPTIPCP